MKTKPTLTPRGDFGPWAKRAQMGWKNQTCGHLERTPPPTEEVTQIKVSELGSPGVGMIPTPCAVVFSTHPPPAAKYENTKILDVGAQNIVPAMSLPVRIP